MSTDDILARVLCDFEARMRGRHIHRALHEELMADLVECAEPWVADAEAFRNGCRSLPPPSRAGGRYPGTSAMRRAGG